jgi:uncharacterized protein YcaQ
MARRRQIPYEDSAETNQPTSAPAITPEERESRMISLAMDLAEKQLREGTASAQVIAHYLRLGTQKDRLEREMLEEKNKLLAAKTEAIKAAEETTKLYAEAIAAFKNYGSHSEEEEYDDDDY